MSKETIYSVNSVLARFSEIALAGTIVIAISSVMVGLVYLIAKGLVS